MTSYKLSHILFNSLDYQFFTKQHNFKNIEKSGNTFHFQPKNTSKTCYKISIVSKMVLNIYHSKYCAIYFQSNSESVVTLQWHSHVSDMFSNLRKSVIIGCQSKSCNRTSNKVKSSATVLQKANLEKLQIVKLKKI